ncbi:MULTISPECIES: type VI secretion system baseplate subunit TssF [unclassified Lysobacter]|uniref:type VI secretion system baseplate subunit TssF n=1 Tax=unclassified Lysobacter TaxID=2635362 RepID=UPI001BE9E74B|nr:MULTISPECIES: type VI secretion system baseplate subunit TssF [unclassified Lysobacter]MBT2744827.1 type VI secretion system baseplate subunit TssF [Lysobacter sp. ISL-42]MBT2752180.1 type VI secretion system baseplate subunit TssF [Lysobacter sp. ISL-50]MBT2778677.1 type VI secretion system baseplate subunit TssF [Lysobacter sp. ISL-54]MBT2780392.1 type VI secretion system baseplate subunit TssF [Lysobacter sp. ISL-52]
MLDELLPYYENELTYLRRLSKEFAGRYPKIAARLMLEGDVCEDPHVERMIESFAFLTARIHKKLDDEFPQITEALLSVLYPHFLRPVPSMSIAQLRPSAGAELTAMQHVPRGTALLSRPVNGVPVRYRTAYPVDIWPLRVADARLESAERSAFALQRPGSVATLRLRLQAEGQTPLSQLDVRKLRFYLDGESPVAHALYEILLNATAAIALRAPKGSPQTPPLQLPREALRAVGFDEDEGLLDYDARSFLGYRLIQEYFVLPEKFLFFELDGLDFSRFEDEVELVFEIQPFGRQERLPRLEQAVNADTFRLNCTPIVNLFKQQAEPIRLSQQRHEYPVIPDVRRPQGLEVYSVDSVRKFSRTADQANVVDFVPFYSIRHGLHDGFEGCHWYAQRHPSSRPNDDGSEMSIALVDRDMNPHVPAVETLSLSLTCTNRDLPSQLPFGGEESLLQVEQGGVIAQARLLKKPTATWRAPMRMANQWRLISHLALNHLSIVGGGREALLEILSLYNYADSASLRKQIAGIVEVDSRPSVTRIGRAPRQAFVRGTDVELTFDESQYVGGGVYLLARVLDVFFGLYCTSNSYTRLSVRSQQREGLLAGFAPRAGALPLV